MNTSKCEQDAGYPARHMRQSASDAAADRHEQARRKSWRAAIRLLTGAPFRVHHYRDVRTRMLHDALCDVDGCDDQPAGRS